MPNLLTTEEQIQVVRNKLSEPGITKAQIEKFEGILRILEEARDEE